MQSVPTSAPCMGPRPAPRSQAARGAARSPYPGRPRPAQDCPGSCCAPPHATASDRTPCRCMFAKRHREDRIDVSFHGSGSVPCEDRDGACPFGGSSTPVTGPAGRWPPSQLWANCRHAATATRSPRRRALVTLFEYHVCDANILIVAYRENLGQSHAYATSPRLRLRQPTAASSPRIRLQPARAT